MKKYRARPGSFAWWFKDIIGGIFFVGAVVTIYCFIYMITI